VPPGARLGRERLEEPFAALGLGLLDMSKVPADLIALIV
jgi:hypothetical protein